MDKVRGKAKDSSIHLSWAHHWPHSNINKGWQIFVLVPSIKGDVSDEVQSLSRFHFYKKFVTDGCPGGPIFYGTLSTRRLPSITDRSNFRHLVKKRSLRYRFFVKSEQDTCSSDGSDVSIFW
ncbi:hypothetical protein AVEN_168908-1 [Araneus ventricosus]|uniref:Uncharacterized protein n=1 Tax=Araneus ventricosus TaxID=182803 RepID=A0A4Y2H6K1_ARAVE|nr:hypothetical protein AVEN_254266-1 [Araneus ventricosus]GBM59878.1 hypothetical protein AVEN_68165-1 [Araneus ventricosus]GBM59909.1 hypothetical protein AVEN_133976-1 [Araneus ventricosus]GBM59954.1 hypothetical protein AVEN_168908-1 [Araneus ventricosus]